MNFSDEGVAWWYRLPLHTEPWFRCPAQKESYTLHIQVFEIHIRIWIPYRHVEQLMNHWKNSVIVFFNFPFI